jgi:hypothetical protein
MIIKIVKVFVRQSLDYFFDVWYNMIDVKIGLAAERFGQFGERRQMRHIRKFTRTLYKKNSVRGSLVGADNIRRTCMHGARCLWSRPEHLLLARLFLYIL